MASILETVSMIAEFGQQQWLYTNFRLSDRTLRSQDRILEFSQELVKICAAARNLDTRVNFGMSGRYNQLVQYGRNAAHKSRAAWAVRSLGVYMSERQHIYKDLNESSSTRPRGSQQLGIPPSSNSKRRPNFSLARRFLLGAEILTPAKVLSYAYIFTRRLYFRHPPIFSWDTKILGIRQYFHETPRFWASANILGIRQYFHETPRF
jgi:hypothetical protein